MSVVIIRPFNPDEDSGFIYATWPKGAYHGAAEPIELTKKQWFKHFYSYVKHRLEDSEISIATLAEDPSIIIGYSILHGTCLEFIYIKEAFRLQGIANLLTKNKHITEVNNVTRIGRLIATKKNLKEKNNGRNDS